MDTNENIQQLLSRTDQLRKQSDALGLSQYLNWEKYNNYSIVHHSTSIEGSTLTEVETELLLDENMTAKGKSMGEHHMVQDHYKALLYVLEQAKKNREVTPDYLKEVAALVMKNTGSVINRITGTFDSSKGDYRLAGAFAGSSTFPDYRKIPDMMKNMCEDIKNDLSSDSSKNSLISSFDAHFKLVSIHPFADGNGRTSRLLMNHIQHQSGQPLTIVFKEDKADYYNALIESRKKEDINIFRKFMLGQHIKHLEGQIKAVKQGEQSTEKMLSDKPEENLSKAIYDGNKKKVDELIVQGVKPNKKHMQLMKEMEQENMKINPDIKKIITENFPSQEKNKGMKI